jgi:hypothetical protein
MYAGLVTNFDHTSQRFIESGSDFANDCILSLVGKVGRVKIGEVVILDPVVEWATG